MLETADILERLATRASGAGELRDVGLDDDVAAVLDAAAAESAPAAERLLALLEERGWKGLTRTERTGPGTSRSQRRAPGW